MNFLEAVKTLLLIVSKIKEFILFAKKKELKDAKDEALNTGDQRKFENNISDIPNELPTGKYNGMYERPIKKKS